MVNDKEITKAFSSLRTAMRKSAAAPAKLPDPCTFWKNLRPSWEAVIQALRALGSLIPVARQAATAMEKVRDMMNALCA